MTFDEWTALQNSLVMVFGPLLFAWVILLITSALAAVVVVTGAFILKGTRF